MFAHRHHLSVGLTGLLLTASGVVPAPPASAAPPAIRFVAVTGDDSQDGMSAGTALRTIQHCADVAVAGDTCEIAAGVYRETVRPVRSGTSAAPITFRAAAGARVTVDGTDPVTGWTKDSGNVYRAAVTLTGTAANPYSSTPYPANADLWANQVFTSSTMVPEASYPPPAANPFTPTYLSGWSSTRSANGACTTPPCTTMLTGTLTYPRFPALGDLTGAVAYFTGGWVALSATVTGGDLDGTNKKIDLSFPRSDDKVMPGGGNAKKVRFVGKKAFLTGPNQWYYNPATRQLYLWAADGGVPAKVFAKRRNYGFDLRGRSDITVSSIRLDATTVVTDDATDGIVLDAVNSRYLSHWQTAQYDSTQPYAGIYDANHRFDSGIVLHGTNNTIRNSTIELSAGNGVNLRGSGHTVENNLIRNVSYGGTYTAAVTLEVGSRAATITHNTMRGIGRDAINMNTNAYPNHGYTDLRIAYNDISGYATSAYDLGGIYVCCDTALTGTRIDHNVIHDPANTGNGLHFDNGAYDVRVDHNVIYGLKGTGDINHGGNGINFGGHTNRPPTGSSLPYLKGVFDNNTIVAGKNYTIFTYFADPAHAANTTVRNNILDGAHPSGQDYGYVAGSRPMLARNLVTQRSSDGTGTDPLYTGTGDYRPQAGSPAIDAGVVIPGVTDGYLGAAPDQGAYEYGSPPWTAGCSWSTCFQAVTR